MDDIFCQYALASGLSIRMRLRKQLLRDIYYHLPLGGTTLDTLNAYYGYQMQPGAYQLILLRMLPENQQEAPVPLSLWLKLEEEMRCALLSGFQEFETIVLDGRIVCLFNITSHRDSPDTARFKVAIGRFFAGLCTGGKYPGCCFILSEGTPAESIAALDHCLQTAQQAMEYGAVYGLNRRYDSYELKKTLGSIMAILTPERKQTLRQLVETCNVVRIEHFLSALFRSSYHQVIDTPALAYQLPHKLLSLTAATLSERVADTGSIAALAALWQQKINDCLALEQLQRLTLAGITALCQEAQKYITDAPALQKAKEYIHDHYREKLFLQDIAAHVHLNPQYLSALFTRQTGVRISDYIARIRMEHACCLLQNTNDSIQMISEAVGYSDPQYFSRRFKQTVGVCPQSYRTGKRP